MPRATRKTGLSGMRKSRSMKGRFAHAHARFRWRQFRNAPRICGKMGKFIYSLFFTYRESELEFLIL